MARKYIISEFMNTNLITISKTATFKEAVSMMTEKMTNGVIVVDEFQKVAGILSSWDIIQYIVPDYLEEDKHLAAFESGDVFIRRIKDVANNPVTEFMTSKVHKIHSEQSLMTAATILSEFHIRQLPVVDHDDVLIGYLNRTDIKKAIAEILSE